MSKHKHHHRLSSARKALQFSRQQGIGPLHGRGYDYRFPHLSIKSAAPSAATPGTAKGGDRESRSTSRLTEDKEDCKGNETAD